MKFIDFNFHPLILKGIKIAGFSEPSPIQKEAIPLILEGFDLVAQAHTGTGKTAAFGLPILEKISGGEIDSALIITPTRELATQISDELYYLGRFANIRTLAVYGGAPYGRQIAIINKGVNIVVATPGRLKDLYQKGKIDNFNPQVVVLDEADEMLDMGFLDAIRDIFEYIPQNRQTLMFSATMPKPILDLANTLLYSPKFVSVVKQNQESKNSEIKQHYLVLQEEQRDEAVVKLLEMQKYKKALIFCRTKKEVDRLSEHLIALGFEAKGLHGDLEQFQRDEIIKNFKRGLIKILIATDVAARGLDIKDVTHVINYHIPFDPQSYVHRIGRTGRAGKKGVAITLVSTKEFRELLRIKKEVGAKMELITIKLEAKELDNEDFKNLNALIKNCEIRKDIEKIIEKLEIKDKELLIKKLLSYTINKERFGSNCLGYSKSDVDRLVNEYLEEQKATKRKKRRRN